MRVHLAAALASSTNARSRLRRIAFLSGARSVLPANIATGIWGLVTGVAMVKAGLSGWQASAMTLLVFAGTAQLAVLPLIALQTPIWLVLTTALMVNLRFVIFSAGLQPYFASLPLQRRLLLGYLTGDVSFAVFLARRLSRLRLPHATAATAAVASTSARARDLQQAFFFGLTAPTWLIWQAGSLLGIALGAQIPDSWELSFVGIVALIAITVPMVVGLPATAGALCAAVVAVVANGLPLKLGLLAAVVAGVAVAVLTEVTVKRAER